MCLSSSNQTKITDETLAIYWWISSFKNSPETYAEIIAWIEVWNIANKYEQEKWEEMNYGEIERLIEEKKFDILNKWTNWDFDINSENYNLVPNIYRKFLEWKLENTENFPLPLTQITENISKKVLKIFDLVEKSV